jgi:ubiquinone/menaquinone biosynthesis C-methylase UbiE
MDLKQVEQDVAEFFDYCAEQRWMEDFLPEEQKKLDSFLSQWNIQPGQRVLEPGCGSGRLTAVLAREVGPGGEVYACDLSAGMLHLARKREMPRQVHLVEESAIKLSRPNGWFDQVICSCVFPHFLAPDKVLEEFYRVLKTGGVLWITHFEGSRRLNQFHNQAAPEVADHTLLEKEAMLQLMQETGFQVNLFEDSEKHYILKAGK